ncbi:hypothetical protein Patl1_34526 [Pistacia atlantica]|uniref:Uncharacterized protein n=1 Tax=Pistacia atlantica TaxID=434234 RepID=A0ACC0ZUA1_9ROSI|nr:hypothetical protein Patl1_34526 [Pistacia atlantica]
MGFLTLLRHLVLKDCPDLKVLIDEVMTSYKCLLEHLEIEDCPSLESLPIGKLPALKSEYLLPGTLVSWIGGLENLRIVSVGLKDLTLLEKFEIANCPKLRSFPWKSLPASLGKLRITSCPLLTQQCSKGRGACWHMVAHIPSLLPFNHSNQCPFLRPCDKSSSGYKKVSVLSTKPGRKLCTKAMLSEISYRKEYTKIGAKSAGPIPPSQLIQVVEIVAKTDAEW